MSLYRMDCDVERRRGLKCIEDHNARELNAAVQRAVRKFGDDFWVMLHGIDAYLERRRRRDTHHVALHGRAEPEEC